MRPYTGTRSTMRFAAVLGAVALAGCVADGYVYEVAPLPAYGSAYGYYPVPPAYYGYPGYYGYGGYYGTTVYRPPVVYYDHDHRGDDCRHESHRRRPYRDGDHSDDDRPDGRGPRPPGDRPPGDRPPRPDAEPVRPPPRGAPPPGVRPPPRGDGPKRQVPTQVQAQAQDDEPHVPQRRRGEPRKDSRRAPE